MKNLTSKILFVTLFLSMSYSSALAIAEVPCMPFPMCIMPPEIPLPIPHVNAAPVIVLNGESTVNVILGSEYVEQGAVCTDAEDGVLDVNISTVGEFKMNTESLGTYVFEYSCHDSSEQENSNAITFRTINVIEAPVVVVPTLSFSSGGGPIPSTPTVVAPVVVGEVLGASTSCGVYSDKFLRRGLDNDVTAVKNLQKFLNENMKSGLVESGMFDLATENALKAFQTAHAANILTPWGLTEATGIFYITTRNEVNNIMCPSLKLPIPTVLVPMATKPN